MQYSGPQVEHKEDPPLAILVREWGCYLLSKGEDYDPSEAP